jgi:hypothetical protein
MAKQGFRGPYKTPKGSRAGKMMTLIASTEGQQVFVWDPTWQKPKRQRTLAELRKNRWRGQA